MRKLLFIIVVIFTTISFSQTVETFSTPGSYTWVCPPNVSQVRVQCWGAGGGGGNSDGGSYNGGQGGGGGAYSEIIISVISGTMYDLFIGQGGLGATISNKLATNGQNSWFKILGQSPNILVLAEGGKSGKNNNNINYDNSGYAINSIGENKFSGGRGNGANQYQGGGGGSSACDNSNGNTSNNGINGGFSCGKGGKGGNGSNNGALDGEDGNQPGGGGGGSDDTKSSSGGNGGNGQIQLEYTPNCVNLSNIQIFSNLNSNNGCGSFVLNALNVPDQLGLKFQWQISEDSINWVNIFKSNSKKISYSTNIDTTYYRLIVKCSNSNDSVISTISKYTLISDYIYAGVVSDNQNICFGSVPSDISLSNPRGDIEWQSSTDSTTWSAAFATQPINIVSGSKIGALQVDKFFRAKVSNTTCGFIYSDVISIKVSPTSNKGTISTYQYICEDEKFADITISGTVGSLQWQKSRDGSQWQDIPNANTTVLNSSLVDTFANYMYFQVKVKSGVCPEVISGLTWVAVNKKTLPGKLIGNQSLCNGDKIKTIKLTNYRASHFNWQYCNSDDTTNNSLWSYFSNNIDADSLTSNKIGSITTKRYFRCTYYNENGACPAITSSAVLVSFSPTSVGGNTTPDQSICEGNTPSNITLSSNIGSSIQWELSKDQINWSKIIGADTNNKVLNGNQIGDLFTTTYVRAAVKSGVCPISYSQSRKITVDSKTLSGQISSNQIICKGSKPNDIELKNYNGTIKWQYTTLASIGSNTWFTYNSTDPKLLGSIIGVLNETRYFRAVVTNGTCQSEISSIDTIIVSPLSVAGEISLNQIVCQGTYSSDISITGNLGNVNWEKSSDSYNWNSITNASGNVLTSSQIGTINSPTYFRGIIKSGSCPSVISNTSFVNIDSLSFGGLTSVNQSLCIGTLPSNVSVSKNRGSLQWQISSDNVNFVDVANAKSNILSPGALTTTKYYRTSALNGVCPKVYSNSIQVLVSPKSTVGSLSSNQTICSGLLPSTISLNTAVGNVTWQYSSNNSTWNILANQSNLSLSSNSIGAISTSRYFKAIVKSGACSSVTSNTILMSVNSKPIVSGGLNKSICKNTSTILSGSGATNYVWDNGIQNGVSFVPTKNTIYTVIGTDNNGCKDTATVSISILPQPTIQIVNPNSSIICQNTMFGLSTNATDVYSYQWKLNGSNIPNATSSTISYNKSGNYTVLGTSKDGCTQLSSIFPITFAPLPSINAGVDRSICTGQSTQLLATQASNYNWKNGIQNGDSVAPTTSTKYVVSTTDNNGCTNEDTLSVTVNDLTYNEIGLSSVGSYVLNGQIYDKSGVYTQVLKNSNGCDSIITLNLIVETLELDNIEYSKIKVYPNPTLDGKLTIESEYEINELRILNSQSKVLDMIKNHQEIDVSSFGRGVYFINCKIQNKNYFLKIIF